VKSEAGSAGTLPGGILGIIAIAAMVCGPAMNGMMLTIVLPILPNIAKDVVGGRDVLIAMPTMGIVAGGIIAGFMMGGVSGKAVGIWAAIAAVVAAIGVATGLTAHAYFYVIALLPLGIAVGGAIAYFIAPLSPRTLMLSTVALFGVVGLAGMVLHDIPLLASRFLIGVIATCGAAASTTMIGEHIPQAVRPRVLGAQMAGSSLVGIVAMIASGNLNDAFGWHASFALFPIISIIVLAVGIPLIPRSAPPASREAALTIGGRPAWKLLVDMWPLYLMLFLLHATAYTPNSQSAFVMESNGIALAGTRAWVQATNQAAIVLAGFAYPLTRRLLGSRWIPAFFLTMMTTGLVLLGSSHGIAVVCIALAFLGTGNGTLFPHQFNLVLNRAAPEIRGRAVGLISSNQFLADSINPFIFPQLALAVGGLHNAITTVGILAGFGALAALIYGTRATNVAVPEGAKSFGH
jgi:MFS family permease